MNVDEAEAGGAVDGVTSPVNFWLCTGGHEGSAVMAAKVRTTWSWPVDLLVR